MLINGKVIETPADKLEEARALCRGVIVHIGLSDHLHIAAEHIRRQLSMDEVGVRDTKPVQEMAKNPPPKSVELHLTSQAKYMAEVAPQTSTVIAANKAEYLSLTRVQAPRTENGSPAPAQRKQTHETDKQAALHAKIQETGAMRSQQLPPFVDVFV